MNTPQTILITGATDGLGLATARALRAQGHHLLIHGRNPAKLTATFAALATIPADATLQTYAADLSLLASADDLATAIAADHDQLDVIINNAGILRTTSPITSEGRDIRFVVNTIAPYRLTRRLLPLLRPGSRVVNLSSAAQAPVDLTALASADSPQLDAMGAYAQSKLSLTMWTRHLATQLGPDGPALIAVNPGSLLATKMVRDGFGMAGSDINRGVDILTKAALSPEFADRSGQYFDNDAGRFAPAHPDAQNPTKCAALVQTLEAILPPLPSPQPA